MPSKLRRTISNEKYIKAIFFYYCSKLVEKQRRLAAHVAALVYHVGLHRAAFLIQVVTFLARSSQRFWMESRIYFDNGYVVRNETCIEPAFLNYRNLSGELPQSNTGNMLADCRSNPSQTPDRIYAI